MLDVKFIRANSELVKAGARKKRVECDVDGLLRLDEERRTLGQEVDGLRARQKNAGKEMAKATPEQRARILEEQKKLKEELGGLEPRLAQIEKSLTELQLRV